MKANFLCCTLTGLDEWTDLGRIVELSAEFPFVEWAVLFTPERSGNGGRFPSTFWIERFGAFALEQKLRTAIHLCGQSVPQFVKKDGFVHELARPFGRVQLNFNHRKRPIDPLEIEQAILVDGRNIITQHNKANQGVWSEVLASQHQVLFDASGGRGIETTDWPAPLGDKICGYAGGLGPDNIATALPAIAAAAGTRPFWIDMEGKLRSDADRFDLDRCEAVLNQVAVWLGHAGSSGA